MAGKLTTPQGKIQIIPINCDVVSMRQEPSEVGVLWGELFKEKERNFLRYHLMDDISNSSYADQFYCHCRVLWQPHMQTGQQRRQMMEKPGGRVVMMLHAQSGDMTNSWALMKFGMTMYEHGLSVIFLDLPGFGRSSVSNVMTVPPERWADDDWRIVSDLLNDYGVRLSHVMAIGESCKIMLRMAACLPEAVGAEHIFINPMFSLDEVYSGHLSPGSNLSNEKLRRFNESRLPKMLDTLKRKEIRIWALFDQKTASRTMDARQCLMYWASRTVAMIYLTDITDRHLVEAQAGAHVPVRILFPCKALRRSFAAFLKGTPGFHPPSNYLEGLATETSTLVSASARSHSVTASQMTTARSMSMCSTTMGFNREVDRRASLPTLRPTSGATAMSGTRPASPPGGAVSIFRSAVVARRRRHDPKPFRERLLSRSEPPPESLIEAHVDRGSLAEAPRDEQDDLERGLEASLHHEVVRQRRMSQVTSIQNTMQQRLSQAGKASSKLPALLVRRLSQASMEGPPPPA